jgi:hypothetical protein
MAKAGRPKGGSGPIKERACANCGRLRAGERFPVLAPKSGTLGPVPSKWRRSKVCEVCHAKAALPRPCRACAELVAPDAFPLTATGHRSRYCTACHAKRPRKDRTCMGCKQSKPATSFLQYSSGSYARRCHACAVTERQDAVCVQCNVLRPYKLYHRYSSGTRSKTCSYCRKVRPNGPKGVVRSDKPCKNCGGPIEFDMAPSRLKLRVTCSEACENASRRKQNKTCLRCKRTLPYHAFDGRNTNRGRKGSCRECLAEDASDLRDDLVLRPSVSMLRTNLKRHAEHRGLPFRLSFPSMRRLHASPCELCGKHMGAVLLRDMAAGYDVANLRPVCRACKRLCKVLSFEKMILQANEIALRHPLDPGAKPCRCAKSKASRSCASAPRNAKG